MTKEGRDSQTNVVECVGSLLLPAHELQELSEHHPESPMSPVTSDREVVGSILLPPVDLSRTPRNVGESKSSTTTKEPLIARLQKRITKELEKPPSEDVPDFWFY